MKKKQSTPEDAETLVVTPGGPRPRRLVHKVGPDEVLSFDKKGEAHIMPRKEITSKKQKGNKHA
jgi:hypothetical protein